MGGRSPRTIVLQRKERNKNKKQLPILRTQWRTGKSSQIQRSWGFLSRVVFHSRRSVAFFFFFFRSNSLCCCWWWWSILPLSHSSITCLRPGEGGGCESGCVSVALKRKGLPLDAGAASIPHTPAHTAPNQKNSSFLHACNTRFNICY